MIFSDEIPVFVVEYALNKMFITIAPLLMYLVDGWETVRCFEDQNTANTFKTFAFPMPNFD
jgi:hypothetical protein